MFLKPDLTAGYHLSGWLTQAVKSLWNQTDDTFLAFSTFAFLNYKFIMKLMSHLCIKGRKEKTHLILILMSACELSNKISLTMNSWDMEFILRDIYCLNFITKIRLKISRNEFKCNLNVFFIADRPAHEKYDNFETTIYWFNRRNEELN